MSTNGFWRCSKRTSSKYSHRAGWLSVTTGFTVSSVILIVDDEKPIRELVRSILSRAGHEVAVAEDAGQALRLLEEGAPDLMLTDIVMPGMSGLALAAQAHHRRPGLRVMFMSGFASQYEEELSGSVCLSKPFTPSQLLAAVEDVLTLKRAE
jgi:CheY-like chemotaxis protein